MAPPVSVSAAPGMPPAAVNRFLRVHLRSPSASWVKDAFLSRADRRVQMPKNASERTVKSGTFRKADFFEYRMSVDTVCSLLIACIGFIQGQTMSPGATNDARRSGRNSRQIHGKADRP